MMFFSGFCAIPRHARWRLLVALRDLVAVTGMQRAGDVRHKPVKRLLARGRIFDAHAVPNIVTAREKRLGVINSIASRPGDHDAARLPMLVSDGLAVARRFKYRGSLVNRIPLAERMKRYRLMEKCAEFTDEVIQFHGEMFRNAKVPLVLRMDAGRWLMNRAYGLPFQAVDVSMVSQETAVQKVIHEVRWLNPDRNDRSREIQPEPIYGITGPDSKKDITKP